MKQRYDVLKKAMGAIHHHNVAQCFRKKTTIHADLLLMWMRQGFQERKVAPCDEYQIVIAKIQPKQNSRPHFHEVGASSFTVITGAEFGFFEPANLMYYSGRLTEDGSAIRETAIHCQENRLLDIFPYQVHQFENRGKKPAHILIVTHPTIYVGAGDEDIYFVPGFANR